MTIFKRTSRAVITALVTIRGLAWPFFLTSVVYQIITFVVFAPLLSGLVRLFLASSGREVVANEEIAAFLTEPIGVIAFIVMAGVSLSVIALQQACFMTLIYSVDHGFAGGVFSALRFGFGRGHHILELALRIVFRLLLMAIPFLAAAGLIYLVLLTEYDINYYLANWPPAFKMALAGGVMLGIGFTIALVFVVPRMLLALPILLFEAYPPRAALSEGAVRVHGHRSVIALGVFLWTLVSLGIASLVTGLFFWFGQSLLLLVLNQMLLLVLVVGALFLAFGLMEFLVSMIIGGGFSLLVMHWYESIGCSELTQKAWQRTDLELAKQPKRGPSGRVMFAAASLAIIASAITGWILISGADIEDRTEIVAHRGSSNVAPENTMAAVERAIAAGADWVEIDVQRTVDDQIVVIHDRDLKRIASKTLVVTESSYAELAEADVGSWFDKAFSAERIPLLETVLEYCRGRIKVNIELKYYAWDERLGQRVIGIVENTGMEDEIVIMSLLQEAVQQVKSLRPGWQMGQLSAAVLGDLTQVDADFLAVHSRMATPRFISRAQDVGKAVQVWTVNDVIGMTQMFGRGVDALITDEPALAGKVLENRAAMDPVVRLLVTAGILLVGEAQHLDPARETTAVP